MLSATLQCGDIGQILWPARSELIGRYRFASNVSYCSCGPIQNQTTVFLGASGDVHVVDAGVHEGQQQPTSVDLQDERGRPMRIVS